MRIAIGCAVLVSAVAAPAAEFPETQISAPGVTVRVQLPDGEKGYYRGTRFDWSGQISSLKANGHEYFGQWNSKYDPKLHDAIMGPVEEFVGAGETSPGYDEAKPGETFVRIGVGLARKAEDKKYERFRSYDIVDGGKWSIRRGKDRIAFTHQLKSPNGYAYTYTKTITLGGTAEEPTMTIAHSLKNTGSKPLNSLQYNHNFFVMDQQPTGPEATVTFPFDLRYSDGKEFPTDLATIDGKQVKYKQVLPPGKSAYAEFAGFGPTGSDYDFRIEHRKAGSGVRIVGDQPIRRIVYWSIASTLCPEAYIDVSTAPGQEKNWTYTYTFYRLK